MMDEIEIVFAEDDGTETRVVIPLIVYGWCSVFGSYAWQHHRIDFLTSDDAISEFFEVMTDEDQQYLERLAGTFGIDMVVSDEAVELMVSMVWAYNRAIAAPLTSIQQMIDEGSDMMGMNPN